MGADQNTSKLNWLDLQRIGAIDPELVEVSKEEHAQLKVQMKCKLVNSH